MDMRERAENTDGGQGRGDRRERTRRTSEKNKKEINSVALVLDRTIPTERPPLVDEISANFCG
jgi:hypothetical protein